MGKLCIKCGYERTPADQGQVGECPRCGVIYERAEAAQMAARQAQQIRLARAVQRQRAHEQDRSLAGFFTFGWMLTPVLVRVSFVIYVILALWGFVVALAKPNPEMAAGLLLSIFVVRIALESTMVLFRLSEDVSEVRALLTEQAANDLR